MRERPKSRCRAQPYALQGPRTRVGVRDFGESGAEKAARRKRRGEGGRREGAEGNGAKAEKPEATEAAVPCE